VTEVVDAELDLEAVRRLPLGDTHDPGVVDEQVDRLVSREDLFGGFPHRVKRAEVERHDGQ
jgi:hypothetical protein